MGGFCAVNEKNESPGLIFIVELWLYLSSIKEVVSLKEFKVQVSVLACGREEGSG